MTAVARQRRIAAAALDFQADLERLVAEPAPLVLRLWPLFGALLLGGLVVLAGQTRLDIVVVAQGRLAADVPAITPAMEERIADTPPASPSARFA